MKSTMVAVCSLYIAIVVAPVASAETIYSQGFDAISGRASLSLPAIGWTMRSGDIQVTNLTDFGGPAIDGSESAPGTVSIAFIPIPQQQPLQKYVLTFRARASAAAHNSGVGFAAVGPEGQFEPLISCMREVSLGNRQQSLDRWG